MPTRRPSGSCRTARGRPTHQIERGPHGRLHVVERREHPLAHRLDHRSAPGADGVAQALKVLVDDAEGAGVAQITVERIGLLGIERGHHQSHHRNRRKLAWREDLARKELAKERHRSRASRRQRVTLGRRALDADRPAHGDEGLIKYQGLAPRRNAPAPSCAGADPRSMSQRRIVAEFWTWKSIDQGNCGPRSRYEPACSSSSSSIRSSGATRIWASTWGECAGPPMQYVPSSASRISGWTRKINSIELAKSSLKLRWHASQ